MRKLLAGCLLLAGVSLLLPSAPTYDPWSWIVWGREVAHLELDTTGGPSWKPLPVAFTAVFAVFGLIDDSIPPMLWILVARAGTLLAVALVFRLARRTVGQGAPGTVAGVVAAAALVLTPQWLRYAAHGNEAPLAVAAMLWAVQCHLDGSRRGAVALGLAACLMRPEVFPFLALYAAWAWRRDPDTRRVIVAGAVALPVLWLGPEWIGSGHPLGAGAQARSQPSWSLSLRDHPWLQLLHRAHREFGWVLETGLGVAVVIAWRRRGRFELALAAVAIAWVALIAAMTQAGFSGNARYLLPAIVIACLLAGVAAGQIVRATPQSTGATVALAAAGCLLLAASFGRVGDLARQATTAAHTTRMDRDLSRAVARAGGGDAVVNRGAPSGDRAFVPHLAWLTTLPVGQVERARGRGLSFNIARRGAVARWAVSSRDQPSMSSRRSLTVTATSQMTNTATGAK